MVTARQCTACARACLELAEQRAAARLELQELRLEPAVLAYDGGGRTVTLHHPVVVYTLRLLGENRTSWEESAQRIARRISTGAAHGSAERKHGPRPALAGLMPSRRTPRDL